MKILLDENLPHELRRYFSEHEVYTVHYMGWDGVKNGLLLSKAAAAGFDLMLTMDSGVPYQQNAAKLPLSVVVLSAPSNDIDDLLPIVPKIRIALPKLPAKSFLHID